MIAIDTNLLVYAHRAMLPEHAHAKQAIEAAAAHRTGWGISYPCIAEFWMVVTHHSTAGAASRPSQAAAFLAELFRAGAVVFYPGAGFAERFAGVAAKRGIQGARIFDLQIAEIAREGGATEIWTHDRAFVSVSGLKVRDPLRT